MHVDHSVPSAQDNRIGELASSDCVLTSDIYLLHFLVPVLATVQVEIDTTLCVRVWLFCDVWLPNILCLIASV